MQQYLKGVRRSKGERARGVDKKQGGKEREGEREERWREGQTGMRCLKMVLTDEVRAFVNRRKTDRKKSVLHRKICDPLCLKTSVLCVSRPEE